MELKDQLSALQTELKTYVEKGQAEMKELGGTTKSTAETVTKLQQQLDAIDKKLVDRAANETVKTFAEELKENESVQRLLRDRKGIANITVKAAHQRKTTIQGSAVPAAQPGILGYDQRPGIVAEVRPPLTLLSLINDRPTELPLISFVKVATPFTPAAMAPETTLKSENAVTFAVADEKVRTIATYIPASRQILDDFNELESYIRTNLPYYVELEEEKQVIAGDATGENMHGLIPQAVAYNTADNVVAAQGSNGPTDTKIDTIGHGLSQQALSLELPPNAIVLNTGDWWKMRLLKDNFGRYLLGDPQSTVQPVLFGLPVAVTPNMPASSWLIGNFTPMATELRTRLDMEVLISTEDVDNFRRNMVTIRAEKRAALITYRPNAFRTGSFIS